MSLTVVWDVDDVLNDLTRVWLEKTWAQEHASLRVSYEEMDENPPCALLGIGLEEYLASLDRFRLSDGYSEMAPDPRICRWLEAYGARCRNVALTATPLRAASTTAAWVFTNFGRWIREFAFIPSPRPGETLPEYDQNKGAWLARMDVPTVLVDDSPQNIAAATAAGAEALCWPRPWNDSRASMDKTLDALTAMLEAG
jgi:hypothetical protein